MRRGCRPAPRRRTTSRSRPGASSRCAGRSGTTSTASTRCTSRTTRTPTCRCASWLSGRRVVYVPDAVADHHYEFGRSPLKMYLLERNRLITVLTDFPGGLLRRVLPALLVVEPLLLVQAVLQGWGRQKVSSMSLAGAQRRQPARAAAAGAGGGHRRRAPSTPHLVSRIEPPMVAAPPGMGLVNARARALLAPRRAGSRAMTAPTGSFRRGTVKVAVGVASFGLANYVFLAGATRLLGPVRFAEFNVFWGLVYGLGLGLCLPFEQEVSRRVAVARGVGRGPGPHAAGRVPHDRPGHGGARRRHRAGRVRPRPAARTSRPSSSSARCPTSPSPWPTSRGARCPGAASSAATPPSSASRARCGSRRWASSPRPWCSPRW